MKSKYLAPIAPYLAVWAGLFVFKSAWATLLGFHAAILFALFVLRPSLPPATLFKPATTVYALSSVLLCASGGIGLRLLWDIFRVTPALPGKLAEIGLTSSSWLPFIAYFSLANPLFEEYFWRGVLGGGTKGFYFGDLVYAGYHLLIVADKAPLYASVLMLVVLTFIGWFWRQLYRKDDSLLAPVLGHMAADFTILLAVYAMTAP